MTYVEVTLDGIKHTHLDGYEVVTRTDVLLPNNLLSANSGLMREKMYLMVVRPLSPGMHTLRAYDEFASICAG